MSHRKLGENVLQEADRITGNDRMHDYGHPLDNHTRTAAFWRLWIHGRYGIDVPFDWRDVCHMNDQQKTSRECNAPGRDNWTDKAGYMRNVEQCAEEEARRAEET